MNSDYINSLILRLCDQPRTFEFISLNLNGFDPVELCDALNNLESKKKITKVNGLWCINREGKKSTIKNSNTAITNFFNEHIGFFGLFDKPHPLDFEWRNSTASLDYLISLVQRINYVHEKTLFLGFPTLFAAACLKDIPQHVTLVEKNPPIIRGLTKLKKDKPNFQIIEADIFKVLPSTIGKYYSVIMDPPWYSPHFYQFMWLASQCVEVGGIIGISIPPINTRPDIGKERVDWFSFCQKHGMCLENLYAQKVHYAMPFFEFNAFRAAGIKDILPFWRKGDLALFRKVYIDKSKRPKLDQKQTEWVEREIDSVRIRVKIEKIKKQASELKITNLIKGDILPSVSTRDKRRDIANVWTSGNRIFNVNNTSKFIQLLDDNKKELAKTVELTMVADFVNTVVEFEKNEYNNYLDWLYHEMERQIN
jgi:hypothetical protein